MKHWKCLPLAIPILLISVIGANSQPGIADQYRAAARAYREAAAKCPQRQSCYLANAAYHDCLAAQLGSGPSRQCAAPTCSMTNPPCSGSSAASSVATGATNPSVSSDANIQALSETVTGVASLIEGWISDREERRRQKDAAADSALRNNMSLSDAIDEEIAKGDSKRNLGDLIDEELNRGDSSPDKKLTADFPATVSAGGLRFAGDGSSAFSSLFDSESWSPWFRLQDKDGKDYLDLDIALWTGNQGLPSADLRDFPTRWVLRNRTNSTLKIYYQLLIQCIHACESGWYKFVLTVPAGKTVAGISSSRYTYSVTGARAISIETAEEGIK